MNDERDYMYRVDYMTRAGWKPYFIAESPEAAKAYMAIWEDKPLKWYDVRGVQMARRKDRDGKYSTFRIMRNSIVTMKEVEEIKARKGTRLASA